jgi:hypothetical protein
MPGVYLQLLIGPTIPIPAPRLLMEAIQRVEVTQSDEGRSGFQVVFQVGRSSTTGIIKDYILLNNPLFRTFNRVILTVTINGLPRVLMDGVITHQQFSPSSEPGRSTFTITGEDVSVMMDREEKSASYPAQNELVIVNRLILSYPQFGLVPLVIPPPTIDTPLPVDRIPTQQGTDLAYITELAERFAYVFYIFPGPVPGANLAYWGPPIRFGIPQKALSVNMGSATNVNSINVQHNALDVTKVAGQVQDRLTNQVLPVRSFVSLRLPLALQPALLFQSSKRTSQFRESGRNIVQALSRVQAETDRSVDNVVTISGEVDTVRYGDLLQLRRLVGLRGMGYIHDGLYYVKSVTHTLQKGDYKQSFTITREGLGTTVPAVTV